MSWVEKTLKDTFRQSLDGTRSNGPITDQDSQCPSSERVWDALNLVLGAAERRQIVDHTSRCASCAMVWQAALSVQREAQNADTPSVTPINQAPISWWQKLLRPAIAGPALAASAALAVALVWINQPSQLEPLASPEASGVLRGAGEVGPKLMDHGPLLTVGETLSWTLFDDAVGYELTLSNESGLVSSAIVASPPYALEDSILSPFSSGEELRWTVTTVGGAADGARSMTQRFILK